MLSQKAETYQQRENTPSLVEPVAAPSGNPAGPNGTNMSCVVQNYPSQEQASRSDSPVKHNFEITKAPRGSLEKDHPQEQHGSPVTPSHMCLFCLQSTPENLQPLYQHIKELPKSSQPANGNHSAQTLTQRETQLVHYECFENFQQSLVEFALLDCDESGHLDKHWQSLLEHLTMTTEASCSAGCAVRGGFLLKYGPDSHLLIHYACALKSDQDCQIDPIRHVLKQKDTLERVNQSFNGFDGRKIIDSSFAELKAEFPGNFRDTREKDSLLMAESDQLKLSEKFPEDDALMKDSLEIPPPDTLMMRQSFKLSQLNVSSLDDPLDGPHKNYTIEILSKNHQKATIQSKLDFPVVSKQSKQQPVNLMQDTPMANEIHPRDSEDTQTFVGVNTDSKPDGDGRTLGKRQRKIPKHLEELEETKSLPFGKPLKKGQETSGSSQDGKQQISAYAQRQALEADPFNKPTLNEIFKPMMAFDKLQTLRKDKALYEIALHPSDLKALGREKRNELLVNLNMDQSDGSSEEDEGRESRPDEERETQIKKRKKRKGALTSYSKRAKSSHQDLQWIENTPANRAIVAERKSLQEKQRKSANQDDEVMPDNQEDPVVEPTEGTRGAEFYEYVPVENQTSLDDLYEKFSVGQYHSLDSVEKDLQVIVEATKRDRCKNDLALRYIDMFFSQAVTFLRKKQAEFLGKWRGWYEGKFQDNMTRYARVSSWYKSPGPRRHYNYISDYKIVTSLSKEERAFQNKMNDAQFDRAQMTEEEQEIASSIKRKEDQVIAKMKTEKKSACDGACCSGEPEDMKAFEDTLVKEAFDAEKSPCQCIKKKVECGADCGCEPEQCRNRQMSRKQALTEGVDFEERTAWGIDLCTAMNLIEICPRDLPLSLRSNFIEKRVLFAIQQQGENGYDILQALNYILQQSSPTQDSYTLNDNGQELFCFTKLEKVLAKVLIDGISNLKSKNEEHFRVHSKGMGIFCKRQEGIAPSNLVVEYFGEIYPPWLWYEKQDVLKQGQNKGQLSKELPDFYNITYERHLDDPTGYDILMVDPILYGNHSSRLSHSCSPNCQTIIKVKQEAKQYSIGMFSSKRIHYGEELCFNYCSVTESEKEYEAATCLCGTVHCTGKFLQLANEKKQMQIMKTHHNFVDRNYILFKAITDWESNRDDCLTPEDFQTLNEFGLKSSALEGAPGWLVKWAACICSYVKYEESQYPSVFRDCYPNVAEELIKLDAKNLRDVKLSNVAITIDKVKHVLQGMGCLDPPLKKLSSLEIYQKFWMGPDSFKARLKDLLAHIEPQFEEEVSYCYNFIRTIDDKASEIAQNPEETETDYGQLMGEIRDIIFYISQTLRGVKSHRVAIQALCDTLILYAKTETYFTPSEYSRVRGEEVQIRKCDVNMDQTSRTNASDLVVQDQSKAAYRGTKDYEPSYIWGQMVGWYKQTVDKPNASLSADRRGTLTIPDLESFLITAKNQENLSSGVKRGKKRRRGDSSESEEVMPTKSSTRTRTVQQSSAVPKRFERQLEPEPKEIKMSYPSRKFQTRKAFLENWKADAPFDTICHWSFKNRGKMYGSVQFESLIKADMMIDPSGDAKLDYFKEVVQEMLQYQHD